MKEREEGLSDPNRTLLQRLIPSRVGDLWGYAIGTALFGVAIGVRELPGLFPAFPEQTSILMGRALVVVTFGIWVLAIHATITRLRIAARPEDRYFRWWSLWRTANTVIRYEVKPGGTLTTQRGDAALERLGSFPAGHTLALAPDGSAIAWSDGSASWWSLIDASGAVKEPQPLDGMGDDVRVLAVRSAGAYVEAIVSTSEGTWLRCSDLPPRRLRDEQSQSAAFAPNREWIALGADGQLVGDGLGTFATDAAVAARLSEILSDETRAPRSLHSILLKRGGLTPQWHLAINLVSDDPKAGDVFVTVGTTGLSTRDLSRRFGDVQLLAGAAGGLELVGRTLRSIRPLGAPGGLP